MFFGQAFLDGLADAAPHLTGVLFNLAERLVGVGKWLVKLFALVANEFFDQGGAFGFGGQGRPQKESGCLFRQQNTFALSLQRTRPAGRKDGWVAIEIYGAVCETFAARFLPLQLRQNANEP